MTMRRRPKSKNVFVQIVAIISTYLAATSDHEKAGKKNKQGAIVAEK